MHLNGIDIASHQGKIALDVVPTDFVIIKATEGTGYVNPFYSDRYEVARSAGKKLGLYHYADGTDPIAEAEFFLSHITNHITEALLALDWEAIGNPLFGSGQDNAWIKKWCDHVFSRTGVRPVVYIQASALHMLEGIGNYGAWVAQYATSNPTGYQETPWNEGAYKCIIRQYTSDGVLSGYGARLDLNKFYGDAHTWSLYANPSLASAEKPKTEPAPSVIPQVQQMSLEEVAREVWRGTYGNGEERRRQLKGRGYDPDKVQEIVNRIAAEQSQHAAVQYTVKAGDTLSAIANKFGTTVDAIASRNGIANPNIIYAGQTIIITGVPVEQPKPITEVWYTVRPGDTLSGIASAHGVNYMDVAKKNGIANPNLIYAGTKLRIK